MRLKKLIKRFIFEEGNRSKLTLGTDVRLNPLTNRLQLKEGAAGFPTTAGLYAKTWVAFPANVKGWIGFEAVVQHGIVDGVEVTALGFRLGDGTNEYRWNGSAWVINTTAWNTEAEVATNIAAFPITSRKLQVIINLSTTDGGHTPEVEMVKVLYNSDIEFQDDLINRSLIPSLRSQVRPIADFPVTLTATTSTINMATTYKLETPYNVVGIDSVYNHTDDPNHLTDIFSSYDPGTKTITLTGSVAAGKVVWVRFYYEPEVAVTTSQEYSEISKVPAIILGEIGLVNAAELAQDDTVLNKAAGTGTKVKAPIQGDLEIVMQVLTDKARDQQFLADEVKRYFTNNPVLRSKGLDEDYRLWLIDEYQQQTVPSQDEIHSGRLRFRIADALFFERSAVDAFPVQQFHLTGDMDAVVE